MERMAVDNTIQVAQILQEEPYASHIAQGLYVQAEVESAVYARIYAEEESVDIQHMIAQFYNKFDELHEKSLMAALAA